MRTPLLLLLVAACATEGAPDATGTATPDALSATSGEPGPTAATEPAHPCFAETMTVAVGEGLLDHAELLPGDPITLVHGGQGGWHVDLTGRVEGTTDLVAVEATLRLLSDDRIIAGLEQQPLRTALVDWDEASCSGEFFGLRSYVDDNGPHTLDTMCTLEGEPAAIEIVLSDLSDPDQARVVASVVDVVIGLDANDASYCHR